ncbi:penicillin-binding protein activator [Saccharospirillum salsuginis]|nr:penicillin-binding protein activator [Saccharospirillum salsuginis]
MLKISFCRRSVRLSAWLMAALLAGCAGQATKTDQAEPVEDAASSEALVTERLDTARDLIEQQRTEEAEVVLSALQFDRLNTAQKTDYAELKAEIALILGDGQEALNWLSGDRAYLFDGLPMERQIQIRFKRAEAHEYAGEYLAASRERIFLAPLLDGDQATYNHEQIWFDLQLVPEESLRTLAESESSPDLTGWLDLALIARENVEDVRQQVLAIDDWINRHPSHPAAQQLPGDLTLLRQIARQQPRNIAVLLPLTGPLEKAGKAIRSGILAAWYEARSLGRETPSLTFFDTALNQDAYNVYKQAVFEGADLVIGPLDKASVQRLQSQEVLSVPVLALNYSDNRNEAPHSFYQFGLAPEDEAEQVANQAWQQGMRRAMVLAPDSDWGRKVSDAFIRRWEIQGGHITSKSLFTRPDQYLNTVKRALNVHDSEQRHRNLQQILGRNIVFEPRRREDIDVVFMVAFPSQARQLKPVLNYQFASDLPVMATSHLYGGSDNPDRDKDLNGVSFVEMPWKLRQTPLENTVEIAFDELYTGYETLVALGVDAYRLYPRLPQLQRFPDARVYGVTGTLRLDEKRRVHRELTWAEFIEGRAETRTGLDDSLSPDTWR